MVVTLGCSLGLIFVFIVLSARTYNNDGLETTQIVHRTTPARPFKISEDNLEQELQRVIESQLAAFRSDDYPKAFEFAASSLRTQMSLPDFERMVKTGFPFIARNTASQFGVILDNGDSALVNVTVLGGGRARHYQYVLLHERSGWKIAGVMETKPVGTTI